MSAPQKDTSAANTPEDSAREQSRTILLEPLSAVSYRTEDLGSMSILFKTAFTAWRRPSLWVTALQLSIVSSLTCMIVLLVTTDPAALKVRKFAKISTFLNVFVGLLLGFFMSSSMTRWYSCANGFLELQDSVRNLQMQLYALGVEDKKSEHILRLGVLSAALLSEELAIAAKLHEDHVSLDSMMARLRTDFSGDDKDERFGPLAVTEGEVKILRRVEDPSGTIWTWIGAMLGRMAQDGDVPPLPSPTYGRLMSLAQSAHAGIRSVRSAIHVQPPYIYVQMLATLVHINNLINALSFGMSAGATLGTALQTHGIIEYEKRARAREAAGDSQNLIVSFFFSCFGPFIYTALLEVSIAIAQPFSSRDGEIPTKRLLMQLQQDLEDGLTMIKNMPPGWKCPSFKAK
jgi:hypothetical protein